MREEYLDIVDERNNPTGETRPRSTVHSTGLWHRTVHIYFLRKKGDIIQFLVHLRAKTKDLNPNKWDTRFGGHVKTGETIENTVIKEIKDEVGLNLVPPDLLEGPFMKRENYPNNEFTKIYFYKFKGDENSLQFRDEEVQRVAWMSTDEIISSMERESNDWSSNRSEFKEIINILKKATTNLVL